MKCACWIFSLQQTKRSFFPFLDGYITRRIKYRLTQQEAEDLFNALIRRIETSTSHCSCICENPEETAQYLRQQLANLRSTNDPETKIKIANQMIKKAKKYDLVSVY